MAFLPEKFRSAQKHARTQFPANHIRPLVIEQRQIAITLNPSGEKMANDSFRSGPDHIRFFELLAACNGHHREFGREAFHMLRFLLQKTLRNQQREVNVLMPGGFKARIQFALQDLPHGVSVRTDNHAAFDDFRRLRHIALQHNILIPGGEIFLTGSDG